MKVAVVGGAGRMGAWFAGYFSTKGFPTMITDLRTEYARSVALSVGAEVKETNISAVREADLVIICVPIVETPEVIKEIAPHMRVGTVLAEVSSVKELAVNALREAVSLGVRPLSIHPMFGPAAKSLKGKTIVVIPVTDGGAEADLAASLFEGAEIVISEQLGHDRAMAIVLSLTYFMNLIFTSVLKETDLISMKRLGGTTFTVQLAIAESIISEGSSLMMSLLGENRFSEKYVDRFIAEAAAIWEIIKGDQKGFTRLYESIRACLEADPDFSRADERRYKAFEALRT